LLSANVEKTCREIKSLKVQGARNVAQAAIRAMALQAEESDANTIPELKSDLLVAADALVTRLFELANISLH
jgi:translation initiation factor 2B subunit (eIF-2B alpha/beta/delta family)